MRTENANQIQNPIESYDTKTNGVVVIKIELTRIDPPVNLDVVVTRILCFDRSA